MQVILKQAEIIAAIKAHLSQKGMDLAGKSVEVSFTAGRKEAGLTADISIEEFGELPIGGDEEANAPVVLTLVTPVTSAPVAPVAAEVVEETPPFDTTPQAEVAEAAPAGKSLFAA